MNEHEALSQIPPHLHDTAAAMSAAGVDWASIVAILLKILPVVVDVFRRKPPAPAGAPSFAPGDSFDAETEKFAEALARHCH